MVCASGAGRAAAFIASLTRRRPHLKAVLSCCTWLSLSLCAVKRSSCELSDAVRDLLAPLRCNSCAARQAVREHTTAAANLESLSLGWQKAATTPTALRRTACARMVTSTAQEGHLEASQRQGRAVSPRGSIQGSDAAQRGPSATKEPQGADEETLSRETAARRGSHHHKRQPQRQHNKNGPRRPQGPAALFETPHF